MLEEEMKLFKWETVATAVKAAGWGVPNGEKCGSISVLGRLIDFCPLEG